MDSELELLADRLDDLESDLIVLAQKKDRATAKKSLSLIPVLLTTIPIIFFFGLSFDVEHQNRRISYSNNGLLEITLLAITTLSGSYAINQHGKRSN